MDTVLRAEAMYELWSYETCRLRDSHSSRATLARKRKGNELGEMKWIRWRDLARAHS